MPAMSWRSGHDRQPAEKVHHRQCAFDHDRLYEGLLPDIMRGLSMFERLNTFVSGVFDLSAVVYYLSVAAFFLFLSVQSMEKRRYN